MKRNKLYFVDKNEELVKKVKALSEKECIKNNPFFNLIAITGDAIEEYHKLKVNIDKSIIKTDTLYLCTASNPEFNPNGGLDAAIVAHLTDRMIRANNAIDPIVAKNNCTEIFNSLEPFTGKFIANNSDMFLFPLISVDSSIFSSHNIIMTNLLALIANSGDMNFVLTGIGTGIGRIDNDSFVNALERALTGNFSDVIFNKDAICHYGSCISSEDCSLYNKNGGLKFYATNFKNLNFNNSIFIDCDFLSSNFINIKGKMEFKNCKINNSLFDNCVLEIETINSTINSNKFKECEITNIRLYYGTYFVDNAIKNSVIGGFYTDETDHIIDNNFSQSELSFYNPDKILSTFEFTEEGLIAYKTFNTTFRAPLSWNIKAGEYIEEQVNENIFTECGNGVNIGNKKFCKEYGDEVTVWKVLVEIKDLPKVTVPIQIIDTGSYKIRAGRVKLLKPMRVRDL